MGKLQAGVVSVTPFEQNCTFLFDDETREGVVIDPGGEVDKLIEAANQNNIIVKAIWLTHGHIDHAGGADELRERLNVEVIGPHEDDRFLLDTLEDKAQMFGFKGTVRNVVPNRFLNDGDVLSIGEHVFEVLHCPGHAPGHVIFYNRAQAFAHVGDVLFRGSIGRTDLPGGNHATLLASIRDKVLPLGDEVGFLCGHGPGGRIGEERRSNPFLQEIV